MGNLFLSVSGVLINPGLIKDTFIFFLLKSKYRLSAKLVRAALDAQFLSLIEFNSILKEF